MNLNQDTKPEKAFYCTDGAVLKNLRELAAKLKTIGADAYKHHANEYKNDFRNWIRDVYGNKILAERVASAKSSKEAAAIVEKALAPKAPQKKKKAVAAKKHRSRKRQKLRRQAKKAVASVTSAKKKEKKKPARKIRKKRKTSSKKITLRRLINSNLKGIARQLGFL